MSSFITLDGTLVAKACEQKLKENLSSIKDKLSLAIIQVGNRADSTKYIEFKKRFADRVDVETIHLLFDENISQEFLCEEINKLNSNNSVNGIIVQLPLPAHINSLLVLDTITPKKDVDGLTSKNLHKLIENEETIIPATSKGILTLLNYYKIEIAGKHVVIVGRSPSVGKPTALLFLNQNATVTICHSHTKDLEKITKEADILIVALGKANFINKNHIKDNAVVVDIGINVTTEGKVVGDVCFDEVKEKVSYITPVPGGVGPMTILSLFENLYETFKKEKLESLS